MRNALRLSSVFSGLVLLGASRTVDGQPIEEWRLVEVRNLRSLNSAFDELCPEVSPDGLSVSFLSGRTGNADELHRWLATRPGPGEPFGAAEDLGPVVRVDLSDCTSSVSCDGLSLLFHVERPGGFGGLDLWLVSRASFDEPFGAPVLLEEGINTAHGECCPSVPCDERTLLFASDRPGGRGGWDLWQAVFVHERMFLRGDANTDGRTELSDAVFLLNYLFLGGAAPPCGKAADANDDGKINIGDPMYFLYALFLWIGFSLPRPYPDCGLDPTADSLTCEGYPPCA